MYDNEDYSCATCYISKLLSYKHSFNHRDYPLFCKSSGLLLEFFLIIISNHLNFFSLKLGVLVINYSFLCVAEIGT